LVFLCERLQRGWQCFLHRDVFCFMKGVFAGMFGLPLWAFARHALPGTALASPLLGALVMMGRLVGASVEAWVIGSYLRRLLLRDCERAGNPGAVS
jgi:hypothetical protein